MWHARLGLLLGIFVWVVPVLGWAGTSKKVPDEARLREAEELRQRYRRLDEEGKYGEAIPLAERACAIVVKDRQD